MKITSNMSAQRHTVIIKKRKKVFSGDLLFFNKENKLVFSFHIHVKLLAFHTIITTCRMVLVHGHVLLQSVKCNKQFQIQLKLPTATT